ncbi:MAG: hypothetical protein ACUVTL_03330 [Thermoproteota archaeon]
MFIWNYEQAISLYGVRLEDEDISEKRLFYDWFVHDYIVQSERMSIIQIFLKEHSKELNEEEMRKLNALANSTFRLLEVLGVRRGIGFDAIDIFDSKRTKFFIFDVSSSIELEKGDIIFARPYPLGTIFSLGGGMLILPKDRQKEIEGYINSNFERFKVKKEKIRSQTCPLAWKITSEQKASQ